MVATIIRFKETLEGTVGLLYFDDIDFYCFTLQPDSKDAERFYIPDGEYIAKRFSGKKWKDTFEIVRPGTSGIDGHKYLLFHSGNIEKHSEGCILLGETISKLEGARAVLNSGATFQKFLFYTKDTDAFEVTLKTVG
jgi:hypothetical protein